MEGSVHEWAGVGWEVAVAVASIIAGSAALTMQVKANSREIAINKRETYEALQEVRDRHDNFVQEVVIMKSKMYDEMARLTVSIERLAVTVEKLEEWLNRKLGV